MLWCLIPYLESADCPDRPPLTTLSYVCCLFESKCRIQNPRRKARWIPGGVCWLGQSGSTCKSCHPDMNSFRAGTPHGTKASGFDSQLTLLARVHDFAFLCSLYHHASIYPSLRVGQRARALQRCIQAIDSPTPKQQSRQHGARQAVG